MHVRTNTLERGLCQLSMLEGLQSSANLSLNEIFSTSFDEVNIIFNVVKHPIFINAVNQTVAMRLTYKPVSNYAMQTSLLKATSTQLYVEVNVKIEDSICKYGASTMQVTVCSDV